MTKPSQVFDAVNFNMEFLAKVPEMIGDQMIVLVVATDIFDVSKVRICVPDTRITRDDIVLLCKGIIHSYESK